MHDRIIFQHIPFPFKVQCEAPSWSLVKSKAPEKSKLTSCLIRDLEGRPVCARLEAFLGR